MSTCEGSSSRAIVAITLASGAALAAARFLLAGRQGGWRWMNIAHCEEDLGSSTPSIPPTSSSTAPQTTTLPGLKSLLELSEAVVVSTKKALEPLRPSLDLVALHASLLSKHMSEHKPRLSLLLASVAAAGAALTAWKVGRWLLSGSKSRSRVLAVIPARYRSSRFEGKPLALIAGKPMIQRTWEQVKLAKTVSRVVVATDDPRIADCCRGFGAEVVMTSPGCENGTERCAEAVLKLSVPFDLVVNVQGDEPLIDPLAVDAVVLTLQNDKSASASTAVTDLKPEASADPNKVKCVVDRKGFALYFTRALIPHNKNGTPNPRYPYLLHIGIYGYDVEFLRQYLLFARSTLEEEEDLEQLRVLENGWRFKVVKVQHDGHGIDHASDIPKIEKLLQEKASAQ